MAQINLYHQLVNVEPVQPTKLRLLIIKDVLNKSVLKRTKNHKKMAHVVASLIFLMMMMLIMPLIRCYKVTKIRLFKIFLINKKKMKRLRRLKKKLKLKLLKKQISLRSMACGI